MTASSRDFTKDVQGTLTDVASAARDPLVFSLASESGYRSDREIDWMWGYSLTRRESVLVPANLVYCPYQASRRHKIMAWTDSNGLATGNNLEEAILHGLLEVVERDAVMISELNRLPLADLLVEDPQPEVREIIQSLEGIGFHCTFKTNLTDLRLPVVSAFLQHQEDSAICSVAFGCHLDPEVALSRALTEAVQLLPPSINHEQWVRSESPKRHLEEATSTVPFRDLTDISSGNLKDNIETCVQILREIGSEVIAVELSLPEIPFPTVRVLAAGLQPLIHDGDMRLSKRFFEVPVRLGYRDRFSDPERIVALPIVGYR